LRASGLSDNTIVIFMNDNGGTGGVNTFNAGMRDRKTTYYDGGHRAMCFIRWPKGGLRPAGDVDALTQIQDLLPTLIELIGLGKPEAVKFDGVTLAPLLRGKTDKLADRTLVVQYGQTPRKYEAAVLWNKWRLVKGTELYDLASDPGQQRDVAEQHPAIARQMREHYDRWWAEVEPRLNDFVPIVIGAAQQNPVTLTAVDWADVYCDNVANCVRPGENKNAPWTVAVARDGRYEFALRRWPKEADIAIVAGAPEAKLTDGVYSAGKALPIAKARLKIGDFDQTLPVEATDRSVVFTVQLETTAKLQMQTWFYDAQGKELCGAYYAYVRRL
jgi:arylsulfatase